MGSVGRAETSRFPGANDNENFLQLMQDGRTLIILIYMYIPPSPISPQCLIPGCFNRTARPVPCQDCGTRVPDSSARQIWTSFRIFSDQTEPSLSAEGGGDGKLLCTRGIGTCGEGKSSTIASICDVGSAAIEAKAAQVACMRLGGEKGTRKGA